MFSRRIWIRTDHPRRLHIPHNVIFARDSEIFLTTSLTPMRILTLFTVVTSTVVQAAGPPGKRFGGFSAGQTFTLTVEDKQSFHTRGGETVRISRVPTGIPDLGVGQTVRFRIGEKGRLRGPLFSLNLERSYRGYNQYLSRSTARNRTQDTAILTKKSARGVRQIAIYFYENKSRKSRYSVSYLLR
jgi:hypothetical protein